MPSEVTNEQTRLEWRRLGFHYSRDGSAQHWLIEGDSVGLAAFAALLRQFGGDLASNPRLDHEHFGPYLYLEFMRSSRADVNAHCIQGSSADFLRLADIADRHAQTLDPGEIAIVRDEFAPSASYRLVLRAHRPGIDPASLDPALSGESSPGQNCAT